MLVLQIKPQLIKSLQLRKWQMQYELKLTKLKCSVFMYANSVTEVNLFSKPSIIGITFAKKVYQHPSLRLLLMTRES